mmetsp:Transcript_516/g.619  ORF Transcript_516/g.619 Transcript_516/m.619 type:complete len:316 (+) Transcript_516:247-1194(+)
MPLDSACVCQKILISVREDGKKEEENVDNNNVETSICFRYTGYLASCRLDEPELLTFANSLQEKCNNYNGCTVFDGPRTVRFRPDEGYFVLGLEVNILSMDIGERSLIFYRDSKPFGNSLIRFGLPEGSDSSVIFQVERLPNRYIGVKSSLPEVVDCEDLVTRARTHKETGNNAFKQADYHEAKNHYRTALRFLRSVNIKEVILKHGPKYEDNLIKTLLIPCYLNMAACELKLGEYSLSIRHCEKVIKRDQHNKKAIFRRSTAKVELSEFEEAAEGIRFLINEDPTDKAVFKLLHSLKQKQENQKEKYRNMFSNQ